MLTTRANYHSLKRRQHMFRTFVRSATRGGAATILIMLALLAGTTTHLFAKTSTISSAKVTIVATGLNNPRGLTFGPHGTLYVAEGGTGRNPFDCRPMSTGSGSHRTVYGWLYLP